MVKALNDVDEVVKISPLVLRLPSGLTNGFSATLMVRGRCVCVGTCSVVSSSLEQAAAIASAAAIRRIVVVFMVIV